MRTIDGNLRRGRGPTVVYPAEDFATMSAAITAAVAGGATAPIGLLWKRGFVGQSLIGAWQYSSALSGIRPIGPVNLANVSATPVGVIASGTGTTRTVDASPLTLGTSGTVTVWDISAGSAIATGVAYTRSGTTVTFTGGDPGATAAGDLLLDVSACELRLGTDWIPSANVTAYFNGSGLLVPPDSGTGGHRQITLPTLFAAAASPDLIAVEAVLDVVEASAAASSYFGFGTLSDDEMALGVNYNNAGTWQRGAVFNARTAPSAQQGSATGTPGTQADVSISYTAQPSTAGNYQYTANVQHGSVTAGLMQTALQNEGNLGLGADGPVSGLCLGWNVVTSGSIGLTLKSFEAFAR